MGNKVIRDIVFGYIDLSEDNVRIIDTPYFQRLKRIRQLTAFALYPSANQTRFEHSLGVMHLGRRVMQTLADSDDLAAVAKAADVGLDRLWATVEYACLLHDVGHAAFSHVGELFYDKQGGLAAIHNLDPVIHAAIGGNKARGSGHELMGVQVVLKHYKDLLPANVDLELLCRMISKAEYPGDHARKALNPLVAILNSTYDVDRLDYVLRDSATTGTMGVSIDVERMIRGYTIKENTLLFLRKALPSVVGLITGRDFLYQWLYNHHTVAYTDCLVESVLQAEFRKSDKRTLFSITAIEEGIDDPAIWEVLRTAWRRNVGEARRLFTREFHKAVWKTTYDWSTCKDMPETKKQDVLLMCKGEGRDADSAKGEGMATRLQNALKLQPNDVIVCMRPQKHFDPTTNRAVFFWVNEKSEPYASLCSKSPFAPATDYPLVFYDHEKVRREDVIRAIAASV
jgi:HD superfamily phosphohydrolase